MNTSLKSASTRSIFSPSCSRSNTFVVRKESTNKATRFSPYSTPTREEKERRIANGPPLRSLIDSKPSIKRKNEDIQLLPKVSVPPEERDFWVTVFGFDKERGTEPIIELFSRHGQIVKTALPNGKNSGNWIHIRYATKIHAEQALQRNGSLMDTYFIGVIQSPNVAYGTESNEWNIVNNADADQSVANKSANGSSSLNSS